jgi:hypothetical protein
MFVFKEELTEKMNMPARFLEFVAVGRDRLAREASTLPVSPSDVETPPREFRFAEIPKGASERKRAVAQQLGKLCCMYY